MQNASVEAFLYLGNVTIPLDVSHYEWRQYVDHRGRPRSKVRAGTWSFATSRLDHTTYQQLLDLMLSATAVVEAHARYLRADGQGTFVTVWGRGCVVHHLYEYFDARGTNGQEPGWVLYFSLAAEEMGREAGTAGEFIPPVAGSYAYKAADAVATVKKLASVAGPVVALEYTFDAFKATIWGADQVDEAVIKQLFTHFNSAKSSPDPAPYWAAMEALVRATTYADPKTGAMQTLNGGWPPASGGYNRRTVYPAPPDKFDRYQKQVELDAEGLPRLGGTFTSPIPKSGAFDYEARALEGKEEEYDLMYEIEILKPLPFPGEEAEIIPWHGHVGNGTQTKMLFPGWDPAANEYPWTWKKLEEEEYIRINYKSSPNGKFEVLPNNQIRLNTNRHVVS